MHRLSTLHRLGMLAVALVLVGWLSPAQAQITFDNGCIGNSDWDCADNWDTDTVPSNGDDVVIGSFTVNGTFTAAALTSLTLNGATLNTDGTMSVGQLDWSGGTINAGATLTILGPGNVWTGGNKSLNGVTFTINSGATVTQSAGTVFLQTGTVLNNAGTYDFENDTDIDYTSGAAPSFVNTGTIRKSASAGTSFFDVFLTNDDGTIDVETGSLRFTRNSSLNDGTYHADAGATLLFDAGIFTASGTLAGTPDGFVGHDASATLTTATTTTLDFGGTGYQWTNGVMSAPGPGLFVNADLLVLTTAGSKVFNGNNTAGDTVLRNEGTVSHEDGAFFLQTGSVLQNLGTYLFLNDTDLDYTSGLASEFVNTGTIRKSAGTGTSFFDVFLTNDDGTIDVETGSLRFTRSANLNDGTYHADTGATLLFDVGIFTASGTLTGTADGFIGHDASATLTTTSTTTLAFGLGGSGYQWINGTVTAPGAGLFVNTGRLVLTTTGNKSLNGDNSGSDIVLRNQGLILHDGGTLFMQSQAVLQNLGTYTLLNDTNIDYTSGNLSEFVNTGTVRKSSGTGTSFFDTFLTNNDGTVDVEEGLLRFTRSADLNDGTYDADAGATLLFDVGIFTATGTLAGNPDGFIGHDASATLIVADGTSATLDFSGTGYQWAGGNITAPGTGVLTNADLFRLSTGSSKTLNGDNASDVIIRNEGILAHEGGTLFMQSATITENAGLYEMLNDVSIDYTSGNLPEIVNEDGATFRKRLGDGTSFIDTPFTNEAGGTVLANDGVLDFTRAPFVNEIGATLGGTAALDPVPENPYVNDGIIAPGTSPGVLTWAGDLTMSASSRFVAEIGGTTVGDDFDQLAVVGDAALGGTLELQIALAGAGIGDTFTILTAGGELTGTFGAIEGPFGYTFDVDVDETTDEVTVEVLTVPNFDLVAQNTNPTGDPIVVAKGGAIQFAYAVTNNTNAPITGDVFFEAKLGATTLAQGVILSGTLPANTSSPVLSFTQGVPGIAPVGTYTYSIKIGQFPSVVVDQVDFTVIVTPAAAREADELAEAWLVEDATPWIGADGAVLMIAPEQPETTAAETAETEELAEAASAAVPETFGLAAAYPNPFQQRTTFALDVPEASRVTVAVYDALGRRVAMLLDEEVEAATHRLSFDASSLPSGVYLVRATGAGTMAMQRVTLVR